MHDQTCVGPSTSIIYKHNFAIPMISLYQDFTVMSWSLLGNYICTYMVTDALVNKSNVCCTTLVNWVSSCYTLLTVFSLTGPVQVTHNILQITQSIFTMPAYSELRYRLTWHHCFFKWPDQMLTNTILVLTFHLLFC